MPNFLFTYRGGTQPETPEEGKAMMMKWKAWLEDLGDAAVEPENALGPFMTVSSDGVKEGSDHSMMGYSVFAAADQEAALELAKGCPFIDMDGAVLEVAEIRVMPTENK